MKSLYESILSSTRSGASGLVKEVKDWLLSIYSINREKIEINDIDIKPGPKNSWKVFFNTGEKSRFPSITISDYNLRDGIIPYDIYSINENGKPIDISYLSLQFDSEKDFIKEVRYKLNFSGCYINKIYGIPDGCKILSFARFSNKPTHVEKIENININAIQCFHVSSSGCGLEIYLNKIKNCKINEFIHIGEDMLCIRGSALVGGKEFSPLAQKVLEEFFKSNDVKPENCRFFPNPSKTKVKYRFGTIKYSKIKKKYIFKGEEKNNMKTLYESILSSTRSGASGIKEPVIEWAKNSENFRYVSDYTIDAEPKGDSWVLYIESKWMHADTQTFEIGMPETNGTGKIPYKIHSVYINGKLARMGYRNLELNDNDVCKETSALKFTRCTLKSIKSLPKSCKSIFFVYGHNLGGGSGTRVQEIKNISLDSFHVICSGDRSGLHCLLSSIKGLNIKNKMQISDGMLGYNSLMRGNKRFTPEASALLDKFFEENKVKPEQCEFLPCNNKLKFEKAKIYKDDKVDCWKLGEIIE